MPITRPNQYNRVLAIGNATTCGDRVSFGFSASWLRLRNREAVDIYVNMRDGSTDSESLATTGGPTPLGAYHTLRVRACSDDTIHGLHSISGLNVVTTSTGAADKLLDIAALGD